MHRINDTTAPPPLWFAVLAYFGIFAGLVGLSFGFVVVVTVWARILYLTIRWAWGLI